MFLEKDDKSGTCCALLEDLRRHNFFPGRWNKITGEMEAEKQKGPVFLKMQKNPKCTRRTEIITGRNCIRCIEREREGEKRDIIDTNIYPGYINYSYK